MEKTEYAISPDGKYIQKQEYKYIYKYTYFPDKKHSKNVESGSHKNNPIPKKEMPI